MCRLWKKNQSWALSQLHRKRVLSIWNSLQICPWSWITACKRHMWDIITVSHSQMQGLFRQKVMQIRWEMQFYAWWAQVWSNTSSEQHQSQTGHEDKFRIINSLTTHRKKWSISIDGFIVDQRQLITFKFIIEIALHFQLIFSFSLAAIFYNLLIFSN